MKRINRSRWTALAAVALVATTNCGEVDVTAVEAARVEISPVDPSVQVDQTIRLDARVLSAEGRELAGHDVAWQSLNPELAEVDADGDVLGVAIGVASIRASSGTASGTVEVTVTPGPSIQLAPADAEFVAVENGATPGDRTIAVSNSGEGTLSGLSVAITHATGEPAGWLSASLAAAVAPTSLLLRADQTGLPPGVYNATVSVSSAVATNAPETVSVKLTVLSPQPAIALGATSITFTTPAGGADPGQQTVSITNAGGGTLSDLTAVVRYPTGAPTGWLAATVGTNAPTTLTLRATLGSLPAGSYEADVHVASSVAQNSPQFVHVTFNVGAALPSIGLAPASLTFTGTSGGSDPAPQDVTITNTGGATLTDLGISVVYPGGQPGGWVSASLDGTTAPATLTVGADAGALAAGTYTATVRVASPVAVNSPREVDVTLELAEAAPAIGLSTATASFATTTHDGDPAPAVIDVTNGGGGTLSGLAATIEYAAGEPTGWLDAALAATTAPTSLTLSATKGALGVGTYTATVRLTAAGASNSPRDVVVTFTISDTPPATPSGLAAAPKSEQRIDLAWTDNSDNESHFAIERSTGGANFAEIGTSASGVTTFADSTGLAASTTYVYRVRACNAAGCSNPSGVATGTTAPAPPTNLTADAAAPTRVALSWTDNSTDETGFRIERSRDGTSWSILRTTAADATTFDDASAVAETSYQYRVSACRSVLCSSVSNTAAATTGVAVPGAPSNLATTVVSSSQIDLSWTAASGSVGEYRIERRTGSGAFTRIATVSGATLSYSNTGLSAATSYTYQVVACNSSGCSTPSNQESATTLPNPPGAPTGLNATTVSSSRIDLVWNAGTGTVGDYRIERATGSGDDDDLDFALIATVGSTTLTYQDDDGLSAGTTYSYRVRACNTGGCSAFSNQDAATTHAPAPGAPGELAASVVSATQIHLEWEGASGAVGEYRIERSAATTPRAWGQIATVSSGTRTFESTGLAPATQYFYRVRACGAGGCSGYSNEASATTHPSTPGAPSTLDAATVSSTEIALTWTAGTGTVAEHVIERRTGAGTFAPIDTVSGSTTTYSDAGLSPATSYTYRVRACNSGGCSGFSNQDEATTLPSAPGAPATLSATSESATEIALSWSAATGTVDEYRIERRTGSGAFAPIDTVPAATTSLTDAGLSPETSYTYRVQACNTGGCSGYSPEASATTHPSTPGAPSTLDAAPVSSTEIALTWVAGTGTVAEHVIERMTGAGAFAPIDTVSGSTTTYSDAGLSPATSYTYRVRACNSGGCSGFSNQDEATTLPTAPGAPATLSATSDSETEIALSWSAATGTVGEYRVERRTDSGAFAPIDTVPAATTSLTDAGLSPETSYTYRVQACNTGGCSGYSPEASATTLPLPPGTPGTPSAEAASASQISLSWTAASGSVDDYRIERRGDTGPFTEVGTVLDGTLSFEDTGLSPASTYTYRVRACNAGGCSSFSGEVSETTLPALPGTPSAPAATAVSTSQIDLAWGSASGTVDDYRIERRTGTTGAYAEIATPDASATSYQDTGLAPETQYFYRLRACNASGCSDYTAEASDITHPPAPGAPPIVTATTTGPTEIDLEWSAATGRVTEYIIARSTVSGGPYADIGSVGGGTFAFQDTDVAFDTDYFYQVRACNITGCGTSGEVSASTRPPGTPASLDASPIDEDRIDLSWDASSGVVEDYHIERKQGSGGTYEEIATVPDGTLFYSDTGLTSETEYFYRVRARNPAGFSDYANEDSAATEDDDDDLVSGLAASPRVPYST